MKIDVLGSGSSGNAYIVENGRTRVLLDCGLSWAKMRKASGYTMARLDGVLVTHEHGDHARGVKDAIRYGLQIYCSRGTAQALDIAEDVHCTNLADGSLTTIGTLNVMALSVEHDAAEPMAFALQSRTSDEILFYATDTPYIPYSMSGITHMMVEANYDAALMDNADLPLNQRIMKSHLSIDGLLEWIRTGRSRDSVREIWLLHMSDRRSDAEDFKRRVQRLTGAAVFVA